MPRKGGDAAGQLVDQIFNGAELTDKGARRPGISWRIAAGIVVRMGTGQCLRDTAAVLCAYMRARDRSGGLRGIRRIGIALVCVLMYTDCFCCITALVVGMGTRLFLYRRSIPACICMCRVMRAQLITCFRLGGQGPHGEQVQAQSQSDYET